MEVPMNTVIRKIGNSEGVILPKELLNKLNLQAGDNVLVVQEGDELRLRRVEDSAEEFERKMQIARERMRKYEKVYRALAK
jgi:putative addiction module antidote